MKLGSSFSLASMSFVLCLISGAARVYAQQQCTADSDCAKSLVCATMASPDHISAQCQLPSCTTDKDCPSGTVCHSMMQCSGSPNPSGGGCLQVKIEQCAYKFDLPCALAADCGGGFTCELPPSGGSPCQNPGGLPVDPNASGDDGGAPTQPMNTCEPSGRCNLVQTVCTKDSDCATGLACSLTPNGSGFCNPLRIGQQNGGANPQGNNGGGAPGSNGGVGGAGGPGGPGGSFGSNGNQQQGDGGMGSGDNGMGFKLCAVANPGASGGSPLAQLIFLGALGIVCHRRRSRAR